MDVLLIYIDENFLSPSRLLLSAVTGVIVIYNFLLNINRDYFLLYTKLFYTPMTYECKIAIFLFFLGGLQYFQFSVKSQQSPQRNKPN